MTAHIRSLLGILGGGASGVLIALAIAHLATPTTVGVSVAVAALCVIGIYACKAVEKDGRRKVDKARHPSSQLQARAEARERGKPPDPTCTYPFCSLSVHFCPATQSKVNVR